MMMEEIDKLMMEEIQKLFSIILAGSFVSHIAFDATLGAAVILIVKRSGR